MSLEAGNAGLNNPALVAIRKRRLAAKLGKQLGISRGAVSMWKKIPPKHALAVAKALKMPVHIVCPEISWPGKIRPRKTRDIKTSTGV